MLMSDREVALDEVIVACKDAAHQYHHGAGSVHDAELSALFRDLAKQRQTKAQALGMHLRELGYLPREPDADKETVQELFSKAKAVLAEDERIALVDEYEQTEAHIAELTATALKQPLPEQVLAALRELQEETVEIRERLAAAKRHCKT